MPETRSLLSRLTCPRCAANLHLTVLPPHDGHVACPQCRETYPYIGGVFGLLCIDSDWFWPLNEFLAHFGLGEKALAGELEADRVAHNTALVSEIMKGATEMSDHSVGVLGPPAGRTLLEIGAGSCGQAKEFADAGFDVMAIDLNPLDLMAARPRASAAQTDNHHRSYFDTSDVYQPADIRFLRVAADLNNLPIETGAFDTVFSRSMLHHLDPLVPAMAEVGRVLRDRGVWAASGEPASARLEWDSRSIVDFSIDYQEGIREQAPPYSQYLEGFARGGMRLLQYDAWHAVYRVNVGLPRRRRYRLQWTGAQQALHPPLHLPHWRLRWMNSAGNFLAAKDRAAQNQNFARDPSRPSAARAEWLFDPRRHEAALRDALRKLIPQDKLASPARIGRLRHPEIQLRGFRLPERAEGRLVRFSTKSARIFLPRRADAASVKLEAWRPAWQGDAALVAAIEINGIPAGEWKLATAGPHAATIPIPPDAQRAQGAYELHVALADCPPAHDGRRLGIGMERASLVSS